MSEAEQGEEQSLEDILSSIREKISATPDMSASVTPAAGSPKSVELKASEDVSPLITPSTNQPEPHTDVFPGGLSDVLNRIDAAEQDEQVVQIDDDDDDLSDLLDEPLPDPVQQLRSLHKSSQSSNVDETVSNSSSASSWPPVGLTGESKATEENSLDDSFSNPNDLGSFKANSASIDNTTTIPEGGLTSRLMATDPLPESDAQDETKSAVNASEAKASASQASSATDEIPRSMSALSSGFAMNTDNKKTISDKTVSSGVAPKTNALSNSAAFGSSPGISAASPSAVSQNTSNTQDQTSSTSERIKLSVSASNAQPVSNPTEPSAIAPAAVSPTANGSLNGQGDQATSTIATAPALTAAMSGATTSLGVGVQPKTIEDMVAEMLRPMLHEWLEANLPRIVENALRIEVSQAMKSPGSEA